MKLLGNYSDCRFMFACYVAKSNWAKFLGLSQHLHILNVMHLSDSPPIDNCCRRSTTVNFLNGWVWPIDSRSWRVTLWVIHWPPTSSFWEPSSNRWKYITIVPYIHPSLCFCLSLCLSYPLPVLLCLPLFRTLCILRWFSFPLSLSLSCTLSLSLSPWWYPGAHVIISPPWLMFCVATKTLLKHLPLLRELTWCNRLYTMAGQSRKSSSSSVSWLRD